MNDSKNEIKALATLIENAGNGLDSLQEKLRAYPTIAIMGGL
jgi:hypothetical protein